jgi:fluoride exporter
VVLSTDVWPRQRLLRPLLGTGVIGGFTTFSTFAVDQQRLMTHGHVGLAIGYLITTFALCLAGTWLGAHLARGAVLRGRR